MLSTGDDACEPRINSIRSSVVATRIAGRWIRITTPTDTATADLVPVPGTDGFGAVVFVSGAGLPVCREPAQPPPPSITLMRVDVLDAPGRAVGCIDLSTPQ